MPSVGIYLQIYLRISAGEREGRGFSTCKIRIVPNQRMVARIQRARNACCMVTSLQVLGSSISMDSGTSELAPARISCLA